MSPTHFWQLHPAEFWWVVEAKRPKRGPNGKGLTDEEAARLYAAAYGNDAT